MDDAQVTLPRLEARNIAKSFGDQQVLADVSFSVDAGQSLAIIGASGSGKSTLLRCLNLIDPPDGGQAVLDGDVYVDSGRVQFEPWEVRREIGLVFQDYNLFPNMTVRQNIMLAPRKNMRMPAADASEQAEDVARALKIEAALDKYPSAISGGQAQRCALARALVLRPKVFLLDEITSALDPVTIADVVDAIQSLRSTPGGQSMAIVFVTHLMHFAESFADRIAFLHGGRILEEHTAAHFFSAAAEPATRAFIKAYAESR